MAQSTSLVASPEGPEEPVTLEGVNGSAVDHGIQIPPTNQPNYSMFKLYLYPRELTGFEGPHMFMCNF